MKTEYDPRHVSKLPEVVHLESTETVQVPTKVWKIKFNETQVAHVLTDYVLLHRFVRSLVGASVEFYPVECVLSVSVPIGDAVDAAEEPRG